MQLPQDLAGLEAVCRTLNEQRGAHAEWLFAHGPQKPLNLRKDELEFRVERGRLFFACWGRDGAQLWRVAAYEIVGEALQLEAERRAGAERAQLRLTPRAGAREAKIELAAARLDLCARLAHLAAAHGQGCRIEQISLSQGATPREPGPYARIVLRRHNLIIYATGPVVPFEAGRVDAFLTSALLWFKSRPGGNAQFWLIVPEAAAELVSERLALLRDAWRDNITLLAHDAEWETVAPQYVPSLDEMLKREVKPLRWPAPKERDDWAAAVAAQYPSAVDVARGRYSVALRWRGLPFALARRVMGEERVWFGLDGKKRQILDAKTQGDWDKLIAALHEHRRHDAPDRRHELYRARSEAWLETLLRQDITRLDPGLVIAPLHAQFRASAPASRPVDLLALRRDGRLAVIELKTNEDREHALQGADYWLRVEQQRRRGHLAAARLFGDLEVADEPALVYLVAPLLSFHRDFTDLAAMLHPQIEAFRFDLNEDWRAGVRVARRLRVGESS